MEPPVKKTHSMARLAVLPKAYDVVSVFDLGPKGAVCVAYLPATKGFATGHNDGAVRVWSAEGALEATLEGHTDFVAVVLAQASGGIVSVSADLTARVWEGGACVAVLRDIWENATGALFAALHARDDNLLLLCSPDPKIAHVWDVAAGSRKAELKGHGDKVRAASALPCGKFVTGSYDSTVRVWTVEGVCEAVLAQPGAVCCLAVTGGGAIVVGGYTNDGGFLASVVDGEPQWTVDTGVGVLSVVPEPLVCHVQTVRMQAIMYFDRAGESETAFAESEAASTALPGGKALIVFSRYSSSQAVVVRLPKRDRFQAIQVLAAAWGTHAGTPPGAFEGDAVGDLVRALCLRRVCRVRGSDDVGMPDEVVEPFGREVVLYL